ncbi:DUF4402 domain-containing protein [Shewanella youngdeokensis]|uniref:DUF4402 domain-containing protein n=1 Tax=Shewanella youngdeokensis TaxID=2999068 RepID=A0ABZ0K0S1_9GAMM|nr:DUF4402 domain-containing protein [Shewanella sp. DAU334]
MKNVSIVASAVSLALVVAASSPVLAESQTTTASVTVKNTFELTIDKPLSFGEIRVKNDDNGTDPDTATVTVFADDAKAPIAASDGNASAQILTAGTPGEVSVSGVAAFTGLSIVLPTGPIDVDAASAPPGTPGFTLVVDDAFITSGTNAGKTYESGNSLLTADETGAASFNFGGILTTDVDAATGTYIDGEYTGSFAIEVNY